MHTVNEIYKDEKDRSEWEKRERVDETHDHRSKIRHRPRGTNSGGNHAIYSWARVPNWIEPRDADGALVVSSEHDTVWERERGVTGARNRSPDHRSLGQRERKGKKENQYK